LTLYSNSFDTPFTETASIYLNVEYGFGVLETKAGISRVDIRDYIAVYFNWQEEE
jgi:hypothetical protein